MENLNMKNALYDKSIRLEIFKESKISNYINFIMQLQLLVHIIEASQVLTYVSKDAHLLFSDYINPMGGQIKCSFHDVSRSICIKG